MSSTRRGSHGPAARVLARRLTAGMWTVIAIGAISAMATTGFSLEPSPTWLVLTVLALFIVLTLARIAVAARTQPRPLPRVLLAVGLVLWAAGSASLNAGGQINATTFPAPGEGFFLAAYVMFAGALLVDVPRRRQSTSGVVSLDAAVVCAGAVSLCGFVLISPLGAGLSASGPTLLLALLYPLLDIVLATVVLAQVVLRQRPTSPATMSIGIGFLVLASADSTFVLNLDRMTYVTNIVVEVLYGIGFALIVMGACAPRRDTDGVMRSRTRGGALIAASAVALLVLAFRPGGEDDWYLVAPAVVTLTAAGARLVLALREAQDAAEARRLSLTDELTSLPNRRAVLAELDRRLRTRNPVSLLLLDLDGFKEINDSLGHAAGDEVLVRVASRLHEWAEGKLVVARLGGDEFAIVSPSDDESHLLRQAARLKDQLQVPLPVEGLNVEVRASVGIAMRTEGPVTAADLLRQADVAMYEAKAARAGALIYDRSRDGFSRDRLLGVADLRRGIGAGELELWYQPQVDAATRRVVSMEALVRWRHPERGLLPPISFLPDARRAGLMPQLSDIVVDHVVGHAGLWRQSGHAFTVSFNCAPPELLGGQVLPLLFRALDSSDLPPDSLLVEVTEDSFVTDPERAREMLLHLRRHQVQAAIDDYGTGFSSLAYLRDLPVQELKIDRSFISTVVSDSRSRVIVDSTRQMAHAMGLRVVAEGVEDAATATALFEMGVDVLQGYHIARPMPAGEVEGWLQQWESGLSPSNLLNFRRLSG